MNCPHCGTENEEKSTLCSNCGAPLHEKARTTEREPPVTVTPTQMVIPALVCGVPAGILSIVIENICCLWVLLAGGLSVFLLRRFNNIVHKIPTYKAFITGGLAGLVASLFIVGNTAVMLSQEDFESVFDDVMTSPEFEEALEGSELTEEEIQEVQEIMRGISSFFRWGLMVVAIVSLAVIPLFSGLAGIIANEVMPARKRS